MKRIILAVFVTLLFYVAIDILIWQRIFESNELWDFADAYHLGWSIALIGFVILGMLLLWPRLFGGIVYAASVIILAHSGLEDILYYWLDGRIIPDRLPWLDQSPLILFSPVTRENLIVSALIWFCIIGCIWIVSKKYIHINKVGEILVGK